MRILFYGGCHAAAMRRIFEGHVPALREAQHLTNYRLIATGTPVPYDEIVRFDAVVFSPVRNKEGYNTLILEEVLTRAGVPFVKYPWLQWTGYTPGAQITSGYGWYSGWWYRSLEEAAQGFRRFEDFEAAVMEGDLLGSLAIDNIDVATAQLAAREADCDVQIAPFVRQNFRDMRLFLTPDHAGNALYLEVCRQVTERLGLTLSPSFAAAGEEIQSGIQMPLLPSVRRALNIGFAVDTYENKMFLGKNHMTMHGFLRMMHDARTVRVARTRNATRIYSADAMITVPPGRLFLVQPMAERSRAGYRDWRFLSAAKGVTENRTVKDRVLSLYPPHWSFGHSLQIPAHEGEQTHLV